MSPATRDEEQPIPVSGLMTAEQLFEFPTTIRRFELIRGRLRMFPPRDAQRAFVSAQFVGELCSFLKVHRCGKGFLGAGFVIQRGPDTVLAPDVAVVSQEKLATTGIPVAFFPCVPDLALEIVSPNDRLKDVEQKAQQWLAAGTRLVWVINPCNRTATIYRSDASPTVIDDHGELTGEDVLPGFQIRLREVLV